VLDVTNFPECIEEGESSEFLKSLIDENTIIVLNKLDLHPIPPSYNLSHLSVKPKAIAHVSCFNNSGIDALIEIITKHLSITFVFSLDLSLSLFQRHIPQG